MKISRFPYAYNDANLSIWSRLNLKAGQAVSGELHLSNYSAEAGYSTSASQDLTGLLGDGQLQLEVTTRIENDLQTTQETWTISPEQLITERNTLYSLDCGQYADELEYFADNPPTDLYAESAEPVNAEPITNAITAPQCGASESTFLTAETNNFWVNICGGDYPYTYMGMDKKNGQQIRLDLTYYEADGSFFEAKNGAYTYNIIFGSTKGSFLTVTQGDNMILQEPLISWE